MSNFTDIEKALINSFKDFDSTTPRGYPNAPMTPENAPDSLWLNLHNLRGKTNPATLGDEGEDNNPGVFQIDLNYPKGKGTKELVDKADAIATAFPAGRVLTYNTQKVTITSTSLDPGRYVGGYYRTSLSITYYARTKRNP